MQRLLPLAIVVVAVATRLFFLDRQSLWGDEGYTWQAISGSLPQTLEQIRAQGSQAPLYFVAQLAWSKLFGTSELGLRSLSALAGAGGVWFVWLLAERLLPQRAAWCAAVLAALSPLWIYYSQEARPYALSATLAAGAGACALRLFDGRRLRRGWLAGYVACAAGAALTHYFALLAILATVAAVPRTRFSLGVWSSATAGAMLPLLVWMGSGWASFASTVASGGPRGLPLPTYLLGVAEAFANGLHTPTGLPMAALALGIALALLGARGRGGVLSASWLLLVLGGAELIGFPSDRPGPWVRYVISALPAFLVLEGAGLEYLWKRNASLGLAAFLALLAMSLFSLGHVYLDPALARFDFRGPVQQLAETVTPADRVLINQGNPAFFYYYSNTQPAPIMLVPPPLAAPEEIHRMMAEATAGAQRVYLVKYMPPDYDPEDQMERWLDAQGIKTAEQWIEHIRLISYDLLPDMTLEDPRAQRLNARLGDSIELLGWSLPVDRQAGQATPLTLFWRATAPVATSFKVFVHVVPPDGSEQRVTQHDSIPGLGTRPVTEWKPGTLVTDVHPLILPAGNWQLSVGMYDPLSGERPVVRVAGRPDDSRVLLGPLTVP